MGSGHEEFRGAHSRLYLLEAEECRHEGPMWHRGVVKRLSEKYDFSVGLDLQALFLEAVSRPLMPVCGAAKRGHGLPL